MEAEYNALSTAMRDVIPLRRLTMELCKCLDLPEVEITNICKTQVFEDNEGALKLSQMEPGRMTPRSKFYGVKYHWFRSQLKPNEIIMRPIRSALQRADFLTKSLREALFKTNRELTCK